jgi:23S rRNA (cytidine1920-2'-O)/16S rRNA (cytidine1409-2'-O)-methyltransferase
VTKTRRRLDAELLRRGLAETREAAQQLVVSGLVTVGGAPADKSSRMVGADEPIVVLGPPPRFVSRGGEKLAAALERFGLNVREATALDAGASTGGFTDCLLQAGAGRVVAVDVGHGQLHPRIRDDPRVEVHERLNVRSVDSARLGTFSLVVADLSFISLRTVVDALIGVSRPDADLVLLVKPQFEAGRAEASRGRGVISDPSVWRRALEDVGAALVQRGAVIMGWMVSPVRGAQGNVEFFVHARVPGRAAAGAGARAGIDEVVAEAVES